MSVGDLWTNPKALSSPAKDRCPPSKNIERANRLKRENDSDKTQARLRCVWGVTLRPRSCPDVSECTGLCRGENMAAVRRDQNEIIPVKLFAKIHDHHQHLTFPKFLPLKCPTNLPMSQTVRVMKPQSTWREWRRPQHLQVPH